MNIYLASPFFCEVEVKNVEYAESVLKERGFSVFSPMRHSVDAEQGTAEWARLVFEMDKAEIDKSDAVVALYYGNNGDTGTAWECGYAFSKNVPVILVHIDPSSDSNVMMHCGCRSNISLGQLGKYDFECKPVFEYEGRAF